MQDGTAGITSGQSNAGKAGMLASLTLVVPTFIVAIRTNTVVIGECPRGRT